MSPRSRVLFVLMALSLTACAKKSREQQIEDDDAKAEAKELKRESSTQREQSRYHVLLTKEIAWVDRRLVHLQEAAAGADGNLRAVKEADILAARSWRARLQQDVGFIDHPPPGTDWSSLKKEFERDLNENRPPSMPRSFEKPYGI
jgi:hypothetical protein